MEVQPTTPSAPAAVQQRGAAAASGAFADTLAAALGTVPRARASSTSAAGEGVTLGTMLDALAGSPASWGSPALGASALGGSVMAAAGAVAPTLGGRAAALGVGPVARPVAVASGSGFGMRVHPVHGDRRMHQGVDMGAGSGTPIHAFAGGTVTFAGPRGGYGNLVIIDHGNGVTTRYAHQSAIGVEVGQRVAAGEAIGAVGATGTATGPHLHFEIRRHGEPVDPDEYLPT